ncbi:hypothetical protein L7F22_019344 [Adiantum nelumboides]|nr:hypothetical protein [Adiantum nelumboides]
MSNDESFKVAGPSSQVMASPVVGGLEGVQISSNNNQTYERFWQAANERAEPGQSRIRRRLPHFPSPPLRIQRVSQLDAELLDAELTSMLLEPLKAALRNIRLTLPTTLEPELLLALRLALYKFSIWDRGATYGAMLQNLRYRNEWAHSGGLQSTSKDARLWRVQLVLYPTLTILLPYLHTKLERQMSSMSFSDLPSTDIRRKFSIGLDRAQRVYSALTLANFLAFLSDGRYRTLTDRMLGMRLTYAQRTMNRNVSFEFLNRQLVWHAFTEFLLFLLPLVRPRRILKTLMRLSTHRWILAAWFAVLPRFISKRVGLYKDEKGRTRINLNAILPASLVGNLNGSSNGAVTIAKYPDLPQGVCAICWERLEDQAGIRTAGQSVVRSGIQLPSLDPIDPSSNPLPSTNSSSSSSSLPIDGAGRPIQPRGIAARTTNVLSSMTSSSGLAYADAMVHTPYRVDPCGHTYCYVCVAGKLLAEEAAEELQESTSDDDDNQDGQQNAAWHCLRCGQGVRSTRRDTGDIVLEKDAGKIDEKPNNEKNDEEA